MYLTPPPPKEGKSDTLKFNVLSVANYTAKNKLKK
jgi:hypothetical protein